MSLSLARMTAAVDEHGMLLVYPLKDRADPPSLWHALYPRATMRWAWDADADPRVEEVWHARERLARSHAVVYGKWWNGRATLFSRDLFRAMLARLRARGDLLAGASHDTRALLQLLEEDSPQPTRALRAMSGLEGRVHEAAYARAMRPLWARLLVVGAGEVAEGGFPSLAVGATSVLFEDLWLASESPDAKTRARGAALLARVSAASPAFSRAFARVERDLR